METVMKTILEIPTGYQLHITTWENDADDYKTQIISGLSFNEVLFYVDFASKFASVNADVPGLGNSYHDDETLKEVLQPILEEHILGATLETRLYGKDLDIREFVEGVLGSPVGYDDSFCRVFSGYKVLYFDIPVSIRAEDVTTAFKV